MKHAVISTTYDPKYLWYLPVVTWVWNKMGYNVICFMPRNENISSLLYLVNSVQVEVGLKQKHIFFNAPENKQPAYDQCIS